MKTFKEFLNENELAFRYGNPTKEHWEKMINSPHWRERYIAVKSPHKEHLDKLVNDPHNDVRYGLAIYSPYKEHLDKLIDDNDIGVASTAHNRQKGVYTHQDVHPATK